MSKHRDRHGRAFAAGAHAALDRFYSVLAPRVIPRAQIELKELIDQLKLEFPKPDAKVNLKSTN